MKRQTVGLQDHSTRQVGSVYGGAHHPDTLQYDRGRMVESVMLSHGNDRMFRSSPPEERSRTGGGASVMSHLEPLAAQGNAGGQDVLFGFFLCIAHEQEPCFTEQDSHDQGLVVDVVSSLERAFVRRDEIAHYPGIDQGIEVSNGAQRYLLVCDDFSERIVERR